MFSARSRFEQRPNALSLAHTRARAQHGQLWDLTVSNPTEAGLATTISLTPLADAAGLHYAPHPLGLLAAREAVVARLAQAGVHARADQTLLTASTSEAYGYLFKLLSDAGDNILVPAPSYPLLDHLLQLEQLRAVRYPLHYDGEWHIDVASLHARIDARTRAIVVVSPNNPTGSFLKRGELEQLAALGLPIISDEVFGSYALTDDPDRAVSALESDRTLVFSLFGLSKLIGLPQVKLAWTCLNGPEAQVAEALQRLEVIADSFLSVSTPVQVAAATLLQRGASTTESILARIRRNWQWLQERLPPGRSAIDRLRCEGGWYAVLRLPAVRSAEEWAIALLTDDAVFVHPGYLYDFPDEAYLVLSLLTPEATLQQGIERLLARVRTVCA